MAFPSRNPYTHGPVRLADKAKLLPDAAQAAALDRLLRARTQEVFSGCPVLEDGYLLPSTKPGWGELRPGDGQIIKQ